MGIPIESRPGTSTGITQNADPIDYVLVVKRNAGTAFNFRILRPDLIVNGALNGNPASVKLGENERLILNGAEQYVPRPIVFDVSRFNPRRVIMPASRVETAPLHSGLSAIKLTHLPSVGGLIEREGYEILSNMYDQAWRVSGREEPSYTVPEIVAGWSLSIIGL